MIAAESNIGSRAGSSRSNDAMFIVVEAQAALAHQIRNPLTVAGLSVEHLLMTESGSEVRERLERLRSSLQAIEHQIRNALVFVRGELSERHTFAVSELVVAMRDAWFSLLSGHAVTWDERYGADDFIDGDLGTLVGALTNLVDNAIGVGGSAVALRVAVESSGDALRISIADNGPGMGEELLARVLQPFVSGRAGGTGLGLSIVDGVTKAHGGRFVLESSVGTGTCATIELPLVSEAAR
jgi:two-component system, sensor histidine kinase FlrB